MFAVRADSTPDITQFFHGRRYQAVTTENSFPVTYYGGADKEGGAQSDRKYFPDTATWLPSVVTDANGRAVIKLKIPDSLTTWRATVRAHSATPGGAGRRQVKVSLPLAVRLGLQVLYTETAVPWPAWCITTPQAAGGVGDAAGAGRRHDGPQSGRDRAGVRQRHREWTIRPRAVGGGAVGAGQVVVHH